MTRPEFQTAAGLVPGRSKDFEERWAKPWARARQAGEGAAAAGPGAVRRCKGMKRRNRRKLATAGGVRLPHFLLDSRLPSAHDERTGPQVRRKWLRYAKALPGRQVGH
jgi:hypothetical protein